MRENSAFGEQLGGRFGVRGVPALVTTTLQKTQVGVTLIESDVAASIMSEPLPREDAYLVHLNLRPCPDHELWIDGHALGKRSFGQGETAIHDLQQSTVALIHSPLGSLMFYLSRRLLNEICEDANAKPIAELFLPPGQSVDDPIVRSLGTTLALATKRPNDVATLFVDHVTLALGAHVAATYGNMRFMCPTASGGLAPWQERRAKEMLSTQMDGAIPLAALARECDLSVSHFTRLFRRSVGQPPHRWLMMQRVERAKGLLRETGLSLAEVALGCGFYDQSHLSRCFRSLVGVGPGAWRRHHGTGRQFGHH